MFCHQCGNELRENARFCFNCGAPVRETAEQAKPAGESDTDTAAAKKTAFPATESSIGTGEPSADPEPQEPGTTEAVPRSTQESAPQEISDTQSPVSQENPIPREPAPQENPDTQETPASAVEIPVDLVLRKGRVTVTGNELRLNQKHYTRKSGKKKFRKEKKPVLIPLSSILGISVEHHKYGGRLFLSLLLFFCFVAGIFYSARYSYHTYNALHTPYRDKELAAQESIMTVICGEGADQLRQYQNSQEENRSAAEALSENLAELEVQQTQEIVDAVSKSDIIDLDSFFNRELFSRAYQEYLQELLEAFQADEALHSWLYSYYETTKAYGGNYFLDTDMWIYSSDEENKFSPGLDSAAGLMKEQYDLDLYEHILYTGRIYITGADFMRVVLSLPGYTVEGAVFAKAYGGVPDASQMSVPGWTRSHYEEFWLYGVDYYSVDTPMWLDYGLTAGDFDLDWNAMIDEGAYYGAYLNFMGKIAPGLPCYGIASYQADDAAYGGMGCSLKGTEPSFNDLIASYVEKHPEFIEELLGNAAYGKLLATSVDEEIAETESQLEKLEQELLDLREQEEDLARLLADADIHRNNYTLLLADIEQHTQKLLCRLLLFSGVSLLCLLGALICLCKFSGFLKRPRHLFVICGQDMEYAFHTRHYRKEQLETLQSRLSGQGNDHDSNPQP